MQSSGVLNGGTGYPTDLWTTSVAGFTALVYIVNFNLLIRMHFVTQYHALSFAIISYGFYEAFMWFTNYVDFGWTQYAVAAGHESASFYLVMTCTVGICLVLDLF